MVQFEALIHSSNMNLFQHLAGFNNFSDSFARYTTICTWMTMMMMWPIWHRVAYNFICFELNFYNNKWSLTLCISSSSSAQMLKCSNVSMDFYAYIINKLIYRKHACEKGQSMLSRVTRIEHWTHVFIVILWRCL